MLIPYGLSNFKQVREGNYFYVDKTPFIPLLEGNAGGRYLLFLRPRRIGKSLFLSMLEHYYDLARADEFDALFTGLAVHRQPTPECNRYLILTLDFSPVNTSAGLEVLRRTFFGAVRSGVMRCLLHYGPRFPLFKTLFDQLPSYQEPEPLINDFMNLVTDVGHKLYVLIDEYDSFANDLLAGGQQSLYLEVIQQTGFVRSFFKTLKAGTQSGAIGRLFMTGVSPVMLDDLASGFNIIKHISTMPRLNAMVGFTHADVERAVDEFWKEHPQLAALPELGDREALLKLLEQFYNGYRFSADTSERVFNSDMVLYFFGELISRERFPRQMLDLNVRVDYGKLQQLARLVGAGGGMHREILEQALTGGSIESSLTEQFGIQGLSGRQEFISLLYYFGLLTMGTQSPTTLQPTLEIPNRVIRNLQWEHLAHAMAQEGDLKLDTQDLEKTLEHMALRGEIEPFLAFFHERVVKAMGVKDLRRFDEKTLKLMLLTFISLSRLFHPLSEKEFAQGYSDLFLGVEPTLAAVRFAWLLEVKYVKTGATPERIEQAFAEAHDQLTRYVSDPHLIPLLTRGRMLKAGTLVFEGARAYRWRAYGG